MEKIILVFLFSFASSLATAQIRTKVLYQDKEVDTSGENAKGIVSKHLDAVQDSLNYEEKAIDQLRNFADEDQWLKRIDSLRQKLQIPNEDKMAGDVSNAMDEISSGRVPAVFRRIYSEKAIKAIYDSLGLDKLPDIPTKEISKEELLDLINEKFSSHPVVYDRDSLSSDLPGENDLSHQALSQSALAELAPLGNLVVESKHLDRLDSIRRVNLREQNLELQEDIVSGEAKVTEVRERLRFWDKTYFEGIIGISNAQGLLLQLSPALGYHFTRNFSMGIGPVIQFQELNHGSALTAIGFRPFVKREFFKRRAYLQAEYIMNPSLIDREAGEDGTHRFLAGGGFLFPVSRSISINTCVLYQFNRNRGTTVGEIPLVFRIGISSEKLKR